MIFSRPPLFTRRKALWRSSWFPLAILALLTSHATVGVRIADLIAQFASKIAHRHFKASPKAEEVELNLRKQMWNLEQHIEELRMQLSAQNIPPALQREECSTFEICPTRVVLRDPAEWASFVWVEIADSALCTLQAPVICGDVAVGIVDFVAQNRCRVRLISDSQFSLSVTTAAKTPNRFPQPQKNPAEGALVGQVRGFGGAIWNSSGTLLIGEGYVPNPPRSSSLDPSHQVPLTNRRFALGDQLVTSGLDGIFPFGLRVGNVGRLEADRPGATRYAFEVICALNLAELKDLAILKKTVAPSSPVNSLRN